MRIEAKITNQPCERPKNLVVFNLSEEDTERLKKGLIGLMGLDEKWWFVETEDLTAHYKQIEPDSKIERAILLTLRTPITGIGKVFFDDEV